MKVKTVPKIPIDRSFEFLPLLNVPVLKRKYLFTFSLLLSTFSITAPPIKAYIAFSLLFDVSRTFVNSVRIDSTCFSLSGHVSPKRRQIAKGSAMYKIFL